MENEIINEDQTENFEHSIDAPEMIEESMLAMTDKKASPRISQMSTLRESKLDDQVDYNVDKILKILCKVLISEVTTEIVSIKPETITKN